MEMNYLLRGRDLHELQVYKRIMLICVTEPGEAHISSLKFAIKFASPI